MFTLVYFTIVFLISCVLLLPFAPIVLLLVLTVDKKGRTGFIYSKIWAYFFMYNNPFWKIKIEGMENVDRKESYVIMSNHQSMMDIPLLYKLPLAFRWVSKREVLSMPVVGWVLWLQRGITISRGDAKSAKKMITKGCDFLANGLSVMIFPEGTRTKTGRVNDFLPGAFLMASRSKKAILPIVIDGGYDVFKGGVKHTFRIKVLPPISAEEIAATKVAQLSNRLHDTIREEHIRMAPDNYKTEEQK